MTPGTSYDNIAWDVTPFGDVDYDYGNYYDYVTSSYGRNIAEHELGWFLRRSYRVSSNVYLVYPSGVVNYYYDVDDYVDYGSYG